MKTSLLFLLLLLASYDYQDFTDRNFLDLPPEEFSGKIISGSCFYQQYTPDGKEPPFEIFPPTVKDVTFVRCNLDNVKLPEGTKIIECTNKIIKVQKDLDDWICNEEGNPIEPLNKELRIKAGISISPDSIPNEKFTEEQRRIFEQQLESEESQDGDVLIYIGGAAAVSLGIAAGYYYLRIKK